ncbi:MAG: DUF167 domain-containing protein [Candidatus Desantisbacteria bacterium]
MKVKVKVKPGAKKDEVEEGEVFVVKTREKPEQGRANKGVIKLLAKHFNVPQANISILSGGKQRDKLIEVVK